MIHSGKTLIKVILVFIGSLCGEMATAQIGSTAVPFLLTSPNARLTSMGESGVALADDATAAFLNPAGLGFQKGQKANVTYTGWLPQYQYRRYRTYDHLIYINGDYKIFIPEIEGTIDASITYFNLSSYEPNPNDVFPISFHEYAISASYGTILTDDLGVGLGVRYVRSKIAAGTEQESEGLDAVSVFSGDIGILYRPSHILIPFTGIDIAKRLGIGFALTNIGPSMSYFNDSQFTESLPTNMRVGIAFDFIKSKSHKVTWTCDFNKLIISRTKSKADPFFTALTKTWTTFSDGSKKNISDIMREVNFGTGIEYCYSNCIALRGGYFYEDPDMGNRRMFTFGMGLRYDIFGLDLSYIALYGKYTDRTPANETLRLTASVNWDKDTSK